MSHNEGWALPVRVMRRRVVPSHVQGVAGDSLPDSSGTSCISQGAEGVIKDPVRTSCASPTTTSVQSRCRAPPDHPKGRSESLRNGAPTRPSAIGFGIFFLQKFFCRLRRTGASLNSGRFPLNPEVVFRPSVDDEVRQSSLEAHPPRPPKIEYGSYRIGAPAPSPPLSQTLRIRPLRPHLPRFLVLLFPEVHMAARRRGHRAG
jgi:hypothetical protein